MASCVVWLFLFPYISPGTAEPTRSAEPHSDACEPFYSGFFPCFREALPLHVSVPEQGSFPSWGLCCRGFEAPEPGELPLTPDDSRWRAPAEGAAESACFDGLFYPAHECCKHGWARAIPAVYAGAAATIGALWNSTELLQFSAESSTRSEYNFWGTSVTSMAYKGDDMAWVHKAFTHGDKDSDSNEGGHPDIHDVELPEHATILDVGGSTGLVAIALAKRFPHARIFTLEPVPLYRMYLHWNLLENDVADRVTIVPYGLGPHGVHILIQAWQFSVPTECAAKMPRHMRSQGDMTITMSEFETRTYEELDEIFHIGQVDLLKLDCEGCEYFANLSSVFNQARYKFIDLHPPDDNFNLPFYSAMNGGGDQYKVFASEPELRSRVAVLYAELCETEQRAYTNSCQLVGQWLERSGML